MAPQKEAKGPGGVDLSVLQSGMRVQAMLQDVWYAAEIVEVSTSKKRAKAPVKVHYAGYKDSEDEWISLDRLRSKALKGAPAAKGAKGKKATAASKDAKPDGPDLSRLEKGMRVQACSGDKWYAAEIIEVSTASRRAKAPIKVHYVGHDVTDDEWIAVDSVRSKALKGAKGAKGKADSSEKAPAGAADLSGLQQGMRVQAMYADVWYAADIVAVSKAKNKAKTPIKVHYAGQDAALDEWISVDRVRSKALKVAAAKGKEAPPAKAAKSAGGAHGLEKGMKLQAMFGEVFYAAEVVEVSTAKKREKAPVKVHYNGYDASEDQWLSLDKLKSKALKAVQDKKAAPAKAGKGEAGNPDLSALQKGMRVQAMFGETWYAAEVVEVSDAKRRAKAPIKVHYEGHDAAEDEWVSVDRVRSKALKGGKKKVTKKKVAK